MAVSISKRKTGSGETRYRAQVRVSGHRHVSKTFSRKKAARDWGREEEDRLNGLPPGAAKGRTVSEAMVRYRREKLPKLKSREVREQHLNWWQGQIGELKLWEIQPFHISDALARLPEPTDPEDIETATRSPSTINRYHSTLSAVFKLACKDWHWMPSNPARQVLRKEEPDGIVRWLSDEERLALLKSCKASKWPGLYPLVLLALTTGARQGELLGLTWDRIDLKAGTAYLEVTKSGERRTLPIRGPALPALRSYAKVRRLDSDFVFPSLDGRNSFTFRPHWEKAVKQAEINNFRFHDLRHTTASYLAMNGATLLEIADVLGHKTLEMVKRYAHLADSHKVGVLEKMNTAVFGEQSND